ILRLNQGFTSSIYVGRYVVPHVSTAHLVLPSAYMPTITGVIDSTHYQLSSATPITIPQTGNAQYHSVEFYQDDQPGFQAALNFAYDSNGGTAYPKIAISLPQGTCFLARPV